MFKSVADIVSYINEHYRIFGFRPDQIKLTPDMHDELVGHINNLFRSFPVDSEVRLAKFMGVDIKRTEEVQDGTKHDVLAKYRDAKLYSSDYRQD